MLYIKRAKRTNKYKNQNKRRKRTRKTDEQKTEKKVKNKCGPKRLITAAWLTTVLQPSHCVAWLLTG